MGMTLDNKNRGMGTKREQTSFILFREGVYLVCRYFSSKQRMHTLFFWCMWLDSFNDIPMGCAFDELLR